MSTLTIALDDDKLKLLQQAARELGVTVEELASCFLDESLGRRQQFQEAARYVLHKNAELYRRLAQ